MGCLKRKVVEARFPASNDVSDPAFTLSPDLARKARDAAQAHRYFVELAGRVTGRKCIYASGAAASMFLAARCRATAPNLHNDSGRRAVA